MNWRRAAELRLWWAEVTHGSERQAQTNRMAQRIATNDFFMPVPQANRRHRDDDESSEFPANSGVIVLN